MLIRLTKTLRICAAGVLVLVYSFVVVLPAFASTFVGDVAAAGCLKHQVAASAAGGPAVAANGHDADSGALETEPETPASRCGTCCGLSCGCHGLSCEFALAGRSFSDVSSHMPLQVIARVSPDIERQAAAFIDRPPKLLVSL